MISEFWSTRLMMSVANGVSVSLFLYREIVGLAPYFWENREAVHNL